MNKELQRIADNIANYNPKEWECASISKADLQADTTVSKTFPTAYHYAKCG